MNNIIIIEIEKSELADLIERSVQKAITCIDIAPPKNKLYTLKEAAAYLKMPVPTFRSHLSKHHIAGSKPGKSWIFRQEDLDNFIEKFRQKTTHEIQQEVNGSLSRKHGCTKR